MSLTDRAIEQTYDDFSGDVPASDHREDAVSP